MENVFTVQGRHAVSSATIRSEDRKTITTSTLQLRWGNTHFHFVRGVLGALGVSGSHPGMSNCFSERKARKIIKFSGQPWEVDVGADSVNFKLVLSVPNTFKVVKSLEALSPDQHEMLQLLSLL